MYLKLNELLISILCEFHLITEPSSLYTNVILRAFLIPYQSCFY